LVVFVFTLTCLLSGVILHVGVKPSKEHP